MSVNTGKLGDGTKCARVRKAGAVLDEQRADLSPSQTLLIKAGNVCNLSSLTLLAVFLCCLLLHLNALFVLLAFPPPSSSFLSILEMPSLPSVSLSISCACFADKFCLLEHQIAAKGF